MGFVIVVFKNRNSTLKFFNVLKNAHIRSLVIATPKIMGYTCGICVKIDKSDYLLAKALQVKMNLEDFLGFYEIKKQLGSLVSKRM